MLYAIFFSSASQRRDSNNKHICNLDMLIIKILRAIMHCSSYRYKNICNLSSLFIVKVTSEGCLLQYDTSLCVESKNVYSSVFCMFSNSFIESFTI